MIFGLLFAMFGIDDIAVALAVSAIAAGATSAYTQNQASKRNKALQESTNNQSIELANTAHQREVADLEAAGLNPVLSADGSGASVPTLTSPFVDGSWGKSLGDSLSSAAKVATLEYPKVESQIDVNTATADNLRAQNANILKQNELLDAQTREVESRIGNNRYPGPLGSSARSVQSAFEDFIEGSKRIGGNAIEKVKKWFSSPSSSNSSKSFERNKGLVIDVQGPPPMMKGNKFL